MHVLPDYNDDFEYKYINTVFKTESIHRSAQVFACELNTELHQEETEKLLMSVTKNVPEFTLDITLSSNELSLPEQM